MARSNWSYMLLAFVMSVSLWYMVVGQARVEQPITLRIEYSGMPSDLVIKKGLVQDITIQLRGPRGLIRTASDSRYTYTVDLSHIKKGINTVPLTTKDLPFTRAFEVVDMKPSRLTLEVDTLVEREIGVDVHMREGTPAGVVVENFTWKPESVLVRGPESVISELLRLHAEVPPPAKSSSKRISTQASIVVPALVEALPVQVDVSYNANIAMRELVITRTLNHAVDLEHFSVAPHQVSVRISVPELDADDEAFLQAITAYFEVPDEASYMSSYGENFGLQALGQQDKAQEPMQTVMASSADVRDLASDLSGELANNSLGISGLEGLHSTLSPTAGDLSSSAMVIQSDELPILAELPESAESSELLDLLGSPESSGASGVSGVSGAPESSGASGELLLTTDVDEALSDALRERVPLPQPSSSVTELVLTTVPVRINAPKGVTIIEITPPEVELMLR